MGRLNVKGRAKLTAMGGVERLRRHTPEQRSFLKEHGKKAYEILALNRAIKKRMNKGHE